MTEGLWVYRAALDRVVDGDTVDFLVDQGFHTRRLQRFRLARIDAPERFSAGGPEAITFVKEWLADPGPWPYRVESHKADGFDKYGRYVAEVLKGLGRGEENLSDALVMAGHAVYRTYTVPVPDVL